MEHVWGNVLKKNMIEMLDSSMLPVFFVEN